MTMKFYKTEEQKIIKTVSPFADTYFINQEFDNIRIEKFIDKEFGARGRQGSYGKIF
jgi:hypothetical protein